MELHRRNGVDAYTLEKRNTYETLKFLKVVPTLPAMRGSKATLLILRMHASSTEAIHAQEKRWNLGTLQLPARQTTILSSCQDNTQFYCNLILVISIFLSHKFSFILLYLFIFIRYFLTFLYIYIFTSGFYTSLFRDCRLVVESLVFKTF